MDKELLRKRRAKKAPFRKWKQGQVAWEKYKGIALEARGKVKEAKVQLELNLTGILGIRGRIGFL